MQTNETVLETQDAQEIEGKELAGKAHEFKKKLAELSTEYGVNILAAVSFKGNDITGVFYEGEENVVIELGLSKIIEQKFNN